MIILLQVDDLKNVIFDSDFKVLFSNTVATFTGEDGAVFIPVGYYRQIQDYLNDFTELPNEGYLAVSLSKYKDITDILAGADVEIVSKENNRFLFLNDVSEGYSLRTNIYMRDAETKDIALRIRYEDFQGARGC